jgi:peptide/nickel transport system substrate-binding protein
MVHSPVPSPFARRTTARGLTRRQVLQRAGGLGAGTVVATGGTGAASMPVPTRSRSAAARQRGDETTLTIATNRTPTELDPHSAFDPGSITALNGQFETLIQVEPGTTDRFVPLLARSWEANDDKSVWTFHLNEGITFQDGTPCDARAVRLSFERELALDLAPATVIRRFIQDVSQIVPSDAGTVVFDLGRPQPRFDAAIASLSGAPIVNADVARQHDVGGDWGHAWAVTNTDGLGTGPYRIVGFDPSQRTVLEKFEGYWQGWDGPHVNTINLRIVPEAETRRELIERGDADIADNISPEALHALTGDASLVLNLNYNLTVNFIYLTATGPLQSPMARQAICHAFPYADVIAGVYEGYAKRAIGPCAELCRGFEPDTFVYDTDLDRARMLLEQAGVQSGTTLTMIVAANSPWVRTIAELLRANLDQLGLKLETQSADYTAIVNTYYGDMPTEERPHLMPAFWSPDYNDGWNHLWPQVSSEAWKVGNAGHYANSEVDALLDQARDAADEATYQAALSRVQQVVTHDDPAAIYVVQPQWPIVLRTEIAGFVPNLVSGELIDFYRLYRQSD